MTFCPVFAIVMSFNAILWLASMSDECTWYNKIFLVPLYWLLAIQLYCVVRCAWLESWLPWILFWHLLVWDLSWIKGKSKLYTKACETTMSWFKVFFSVSVACTAFWFVCNGFCFLTPTHQNCWHSTRQQRDCALGLSDMYAVCSVLHYSRALSPCTKPVLHSTGTAKWLCRGAFRFVCHVFCLSLFPFPLAMYICTSSVWTRQRQQSDCAVGLSDLYAMRSVV